MPVAGEKRARPGTRVRPGKAKAAAGGKQAVTTAAEKEEEEQQEEKEEEKEEEAAQEVAEEKMVTMFFSFRYLPTNEVCRYLSTYVSKSVLWVKHLSERYQ